MKYTIKELLNQYKVIVPLIQRDYAQGRDTEIDLRKGFVGKIKKSLEPKTLALNLDFVYGYTEMIREGIKAFIPIDGQQRLTTLWLLSWYLAPREIKIEHEETLFVLPSDVKEYLSSFTYQTRISSKRFCYNLVMKSLPDLEGCLLSDVIKDAPWFMASWSDDPTIISMLNMLDTINEANFEKEVSWDNLTNGRKITFDYIDIKSDEFKLTDELYIKMNSRGKPLTSFESFKAQFSDLLSSKKTDYSDDKIAYQKIKVTYQQYFAFNIDSTWMDLFWKYRSKVSMKIDDCFLNFIFFISEALFYKNNADAASADFKRDFDFLNTTFSSKGNIGFLFNSLDFFAGLSDVDEFFKELFKNLSTFDNYPKDYFLRAISNTGFDVKDKALLYSILVYCINTKTETVNEGLKNFIRIIRNQLIAVRQPNQSKRIEYASNLRMTNFSEYARFIDGLLNLIIQNEKGPVYKVFSESNLSGFTKDNINIEKSKAEFIMSNPKLQNSIFELEEHRYIQGNTTNFKLDGIDIEEKIKAFYQIWEKSVPDTLIIRAFLTFGDYAVNTHSYSALGGIIFFGCADNWNRILTSNVKEERINISSMLDDFLSRYLKTKGDSASEKLNCLINNFKPETKDWIYYFVKYDSITENPYLDLNLFTWSNDDFNINYLGNSGSHPLHSYHLNPYLIVIGQHFANNKKVLLYKGRFAELSYLVINKKVSLTINLEGWIINPLRHFVISDVLIKKFNLIHKDGTYILVETDKKDRIEIAIEFIEELLTL
jgi:hypothetical protein